MGKVGWANLVFLNLLWPVHIFSAAAGMAWPGPLMVLMYGAWQLHARNRVPGDRRIVVVAFLGKVVLPIINGPEKLMGRRSRSKIWETAKPSFKCGPLEGANWRTIKNS